MSLLTTTTWSPSSYKLQFPFKFRKSPTTLFVRARVLNFDRQFRALCVAGDGAKSSIDSERRVTGSNSWTSADASAADALSDWSGSEPSDDPRQKKGLAGIVGAGFAGFFLVAGLTFAALSVGKRSNLRLKQEMEPLTKQQEVSLTSGEEVYGAEHDKMEGKDIVQDEKNLQNDHSTESKMGIKEISPSSFDFVEDVGGSTLVATEVKSSSKHENYISSGQDASIKEDLQYHSGFNGPNASESSPILAQLPESEIVDGQSDTSGFGGANKRIENSLANVEPTDISPYASNLKAIGSTDQERVLGSSESNISPYVDKSFPGTVSDGPTKPDSSNGSVSSNLDVSSVPNILPKGDERSVTSPSNKDDFDMRNAIQVSADGHSLAQSISKLEESLSSSASQSAQSFSNKPAAIGENDANYSRPGLESESSQNSFTSSGIPAPSVLSPSLLVSPGNVLVPAAVDQVQGQTLSALQVLKVIETDAQPGDLCTRREYARWLVSASGALSRNPISKVYAAMYIENVTELAFDDISPEDPDFASIQGLAEAGLISSKLSRHDMLLSSEEDIGPFHFFPDSPLSRQDLVTWKMALEKRQLPEADRTILCQLSGFIDVDRIHPDAWPALIADISAGEHGIIALAFGYTRLFQPDKPVTKAQAAIALATGEAADMVSEELARIEAESIAENAVAAHNALVAEVEKDVNASFEKELLVEREKIDAVEKLAEEAKKELERLRAEREKDNIALMKERAAIESEMELLSKLRHELEEQMESLLSKKVEISYEKERIEKLQKTTEEENRAIASLQYELEVERKALAMARAWAEDEAKRVREHAKALEEARERWERQGIKVVVDDDLQEQASAGVTWVNVEKQLSVDGTVKRAENLVDKLRYMAAEVEGKSRQVIDKIIEEMLFLISLLKEWMAEASRRTVELKDVSISRASGSIQELQNHTTGFSVAVREGVEKLTQKFKA
ncbi:hypothetical protein Ancab_009749 [Ancistrocladus abbreviatus]